MNMPQPASVNEYRPVCVRIGWYVSDNVLRTMCHVPGDRVVRADNGMGGRGAMGRAQMKVKGVSALGEVRPGRGLGWGCKGSAG